MEEIWKDIIIDGYDYTGYYQISNLGRVKSLERFIKTKNGNILHYKEKILKFGTNKKGYLNVNLTKNSKSKNFRISRLVATMFIPNPNNYPQVGHKDDLKDKTNNCVDNLYWTTNLENARTNGRRNRLSESHKGEKNYWYGRKPSFGK